MLLFSAAAEEEEGDGCYGDGDKGVTTAGTDDDADVVVATAVVVAAGAAQGRAVDTSTKAPREFYDVVRLSLLYPTSIGVGCSLTANSVDCSLLACSRPLPVGQ